MSYRERLAPVKIAMKRMNEAITAYEQRHAEAKATEIIYATAEGGALRRASMDLTRALAQLRRTKP